MRLIQTQTLGTSTTLVTFSSSPQTYTDLVLLTSIRGSNSYALVRPNGSTGNLSNRLIYAGSGFVQSRSGGFFPRWWGLAGWTDQTADTFSNGSLYIANYTSSSLKTMSSESVNENNSQFNFELIISALTTESTAAITSLGIDLDGAGTMFAGSTFSLYGILKGSDGIVTTSP